MDGRWSSLMVVTAQTSCASLCFCDSAGQLGVGAQGPRLPSRVIDQCVDPGTRHIVLKYNDGRRRGDRLRASSFRLPRSTPWAGGRSSR
jgi:hypothetical protein